MDIPRKADRMMLLILATVFLVEYSTALRIKSPPKFHPDMVLNNPYIKVVGEKLRLPCKVTGNPKPFKLWYKNNQPLSAKDERWKTNRNALIIDHLELNDTAVYHCHTQNSLGEKWINYTVEVKKEIKDYTDYEYYDEDSCDVDGPPTFTREKTIGYWIARSERSPVMLKCSACGYPKPTIKWYKNEQYIDPKVKKAKYKVHGYQLDIESLSIEETGNYTCILENQHGKLNFTYLLEVLIIVGPTNQTVVAGSDARFECKVLSSDLQHHIQWLQHYTVNGSYRDPNGKPYVNIIQQSMPNITQPEVLIIKNVTKEEDGWYTCLISNPMGREYQSAWLTVIQFVGPSNMRIINATEDGSVYATEGHTIQLNCSVQSGTPKETITWKTGDSVLNVGGPMSLLYTFIPTRDDNLKYFTCSARNGMEIHPLEQTVQIKVAYPPKVTIEGDDEIEIREGQSLTLICTSDYDLEYVKWIRNNKTEDSALVTTAQNVSRLSIKNISRSFNGRYECQVPKRGQVGSDSVFVKVKYTTTTNYTGLATGERQDVRCDADSMSVFIPTALLSQDEYLTWRDPHCKPKNNGTHLVSRISHTECGTTVNFTTGEVIFENDLFIQKNGKTQISSNDTIDFGGTDSDIIPVRCIYPRRENVTLSYRPAPTHIRFYEKRHGHMDLDFEQYQSEKFVNVIPVMYSPREVPLNKDMFIRLHAMHTNSTAIAIKVDSCIATPSIMPAYGNMHRLIDQGCPTSPAVKLYPSSFDEFKFSVRTFEFKSSPGSVVYIHCQISICSATNPQCITGCRSRHRREVDETSDSSHLVSGGPYILVADEGSIQMSTIVASICACIAVIATVVAVIGWRRRSTSEATPKL